MPKAIEMGKAHAFLYGKIVKDSKAKNLKDAKERQKHYNATKGAGRLDDCIEVIGEEETKRYFMAGISGTWPKKPLRPRGK